MAVYRISEICPRCGKKINAKHQDQSDLPWMLRKIGDTFLGWDWEGHKCNLFDVIKLKIANKLKKE